MGILSNATGMIQQPQEYVQNTVAAPGGTGALTDKFAARKAKLIASGQSVTGDPTTASTAAAMGRPNDWTIPLRNAESTMQTQAEWAARKNGTWSPTANYGEGQISKPASYEPIGTGTNSNASAINTLNSLREAGGEPTSNQGGVDAHKKGILSSVSNNNQSMNSANNGAAGYNPAMLGSPTQLNVTANQTVAGNMASLMNPDNPYYQAAANAGAQAAAARGLNNSSIGQSAVMNSVIQNSIPIATTDAGTYAKAAGYNTDMRNQFANTNVNALNSAGQFNAGQSNQLYQANLSAATQRYAADLSASTQTALATMNNDSQARISQAHDANSVLMANNSNAQTSWQYYVNALSTIDNNAGMDAEAKATARDGARITFDQQMSNIRNGTYKGSNIQYSSNTNDPDAPQDAAQDQAIPENTPGRYNSPTIETGVKNSGGVDVSDQLNFGSNGYSDGRRPR